MLLAVIRKIKNKFGLNLCLFLGILLLVGMFACHPLLLRGGESKLLEKLFDDYISENQEYPSIFFRKWTYDSKNSTSVDDVVEAMNSYKNKWNEYVDVDILQLQQLYRLPFSRATNEDIGGAGVDLSMWGSPNYRDHIEVVEGELDDLQIMNADDEDWYPCIISESTADTGKLYVGAKLLYKQVVNKNDYKPLRLYVAGIYKRASYSDDYWLYELDKDGDIAILTDELFNKVLAEYEDVDQVYCYERVFLDYTQITPEKADKYKNYIDQFYSADSLFSTSLKPLLKTYQREARSASMILFALELPCIILMIMFIYMVLSRILASEETEVSVWRSRGFKRYQILWMYILQIIVVGIPAYAAGIALGYGLCLLGASTNSFLSFVHKDISSYQMTPQAFVYGAIAIVVILIFVAFPIWIKSKMTIVDVKRINKYKKKTNVLEKVFVDVILLGVSIYLLTNFEKQRNSIIAGILAGNSQDPIIFLNASLFILACGLVTLRLTKYLINIIYLLGRKHFGAASYAAYLQTKRTYEASRILAVFLVMTIASGFFDASLASAINKSNDERVKYDVAVDAKTSEVWKSKIFTVDGVRNVNYIEPDYERYIRAAETDLIESQTRVIVDNRVTAKWKREAIDNCVYMGIITDEFGRTAFLKDGINEEHWYNALNALAENPDGIIISRNLSEKTGTDIGGIINYIKYADSRDREGTELEGRVVAIVDGFPSFSHYTYSENDEGGLTETEHYLIVGNFAYGVSKFSSYPYEVWYSLAEGAESAELEKVLNDEGIKTRQMTLLSHEIEEVQSGAIVQILNAIFTISFLLCSIITVIGFLIYWVVSIKSRELLFGVYRAMGMHMNEVGRLLFTEVLFCSIIPALGAIGIGVLTAKYFSKLPAYVCIPQKHIIPLYIGFETDRLYALGAGILVIVMICLIVIRQVIRHMNIAQALKLGED